MSAKRLLLVDDEDEVTRILAKRLERRGYVCAVACDGAEALKTLAGAAFSVVIMDVKMPGMDGMEALAAMSARQIKTQVILLSGHADMQLAVQAMSLGAFAYLMKPVEFDELLFKIEDAATQGRLEAQG